MRDTQKITFDGEGDQEVYKISLIFSFCLIQDNRLFSFVLAGY